MEMSGLWDDVFGQIVATGKNVVAPSMDPESVPVSMNEYLEVDDEVNSNDSLERHMEKDIVLDNTQGDILTPSFEHVAPLLHAKAKSTSTTIENVKKRCRKQTPAALTYQENMALVGETSRQMLSLMRGDIGSSNSSCETLEFKDAFKELMRLVTGGYMERKSQVWCYAFTELAKEERHNIFMIMEDDEDKVAWLNHEYEMMRLRLPK